MCTLALYFRAFEKYPLVVAANRDEHYDRPSLAPEVLSSNRRILAGKDLRAGGTWLGVNEQGLLAAILNRRVDADQPAPAQTRSRGLLCLDMLNFSKAAEARQCLEHEETNTYQPFSLVVADRHQAWAAFNSDEKIESMSLGSGLHVFSSAAKHNERSEKKERAYGLFSSLSPKLRDTEDISLWPTLLANVLSDHTPSNNNTSDGQDAICVHREASGTVSSSIVIYSPRDYWFRSFFCAAAPCRNPFTELPTFPVL